MPPLWNGLLMSGENLIPEAKVSVKLRGESRVCLEIWTVETCGAGRKIIPYHRVERDLTSVILNDY